METGRLKVTVNKNKPPRVQLEYQGRIISPPQAEIDQRLWNGIEKRDGEEVEFHLVNGQPKGVQPMNGGTDAPVAARAGYFHNPYNFIPSPPRKQLDGPLGDHVSVSQDTLHLDRYSGVLRVRMTVNTPLLLPDTEKFTEAPNGHKTFPVRLDREGKPLVPASSVRGMLRSTYEAITNSRFGCFSNTHQSRLAFRMDTKEGLVLVPARIQDGRIQLMCGSSKIGNRGPDGPQYAAWLPRYFGERKSTANAVVYPDGSLPQHGQQVECWLEQFEHQRARFKYWAVRVIVPIGTPLGVEPEPTKDSGGNHKPLAVAMKRGKGWVCVTNANIKGKHDERVFFNETDLISSAVSDAHRSQWRELIENYQSIHQDELKDRKKAIQRPDEYLGQTPGKTAWSRHVYNSTELELVDGTLCYARLNERGEVVALFPVMLSRELYADSPWNLLHQSLRPANSIDQLSPADRVFGWVRNSGVTDGDKTEPAAIRGMLRVGPVKCETTNCVEKFPKALPLAILAAPKPQQGRFYVGTPQGTSQSSGAYLSKKDAGYASNKLLRGRKVYPHQNLPTNHWDAPLVDRTQRPPDDEMGHRQEYRRPQKNSAEQQDSQNRSILGWVKPQTLFTFDLHISNLSAVELGALIWLLSQPEDHYFRFGGGRPFGFGSVHLALGSSDLRTGKDLVGRYSAWVSPSPSDHCDYARQEFEKAVQQSYSAPFTQVPFIKAVLSAFRGTHNPVHYPRISSAPDPDGKSYEWFVKNEKSDRPSVLPEIYNDQGLPITPSERPKR
jgi:CRISPR-associated protein (TIGR03986 family)